MTNEEGTGSMTLWVLCEHGKGDGHFYGIDFTTTPVTTGAWCPGGRLATPEDLAEALGGGKVWWCEEHNASQGSGRGWCSKGYLERGPEHCRMVERVLSPALVEEKP